MERDFLGLHSKEPGVMFKEKVNIDGYKEIGSTGRPGFQWPFSDKVSAVPQLMSYSFGRGDGTEKLGSDSLVYPGFMPISTAGAAEVQKSYTPNRQGGSPFNPFQNDVYPVQSPYDMKMFPVSNQAVSLSLSHPCMMNNFATASQNLPFASRKPQLLEGIPVTTSHSILPNFGSVVGTTDPRNNVRASGSPAQLTIFYGGAVNVYEDITPEKAQAIMFKAANGSPLDSNVAHSEVLVPTPTSKPVQVDSIPANQFVNKQLCSGLASPLSISSHTDARSMCGSTSSEELMEYKTTESPTTPISRMGPPKFVNTAGSVSAAGMMPSIPQARKASLARFLEKRKERVMNIAPYNLSKKCFDCGTAESNA